MRMNGADNRHGKYCKTNGNKQKFADMAPSKT